MSLARAVDKQEASPDTKVELVEGPSHGRFLVEPPTTLGSWPDYQYLGDTGYGGTDTFTVRVHLAESIIQATYFTQVVVGDSAAATHCRKKFGRSAWRLD